MLYDALRPLLFALEPERAHRLTIAALRAAPRRTPAPDPPSLATMLAGLGLPNPIGLAAGFDKDAEVPAALLGLGFGFVEVGTLTPRPQTGNPRPRLARLVDDRAVINRLGFNNGGQEAALARLAGPRAGIVGVNIGANKDAADRLADYAEGARQMAPVADYLTVNISSPNTPGLRALQTGDTLADLLARVLAVRPGVPVFVKIAPDLSEAELDAIADVALATGAAGLIATNTTIARPPSLRSAQAAFEGGLSGAPLFDRSTEVLRHLRRRTAGRIALIGVGGVSSGAQAYAKIRAGADAVQLYTGLVYGGPGLVGRLKRELAACLARDGFARVADAVGADA
jgi:dihydroorotate dehydrogenase